MGRTIVDKITKSFKAVCAVPASEMRIVDGTKISPALKGLLEAFDEVAGAKGVETEIVIRISGREDRIYSIVLDQAEQIQEVLQWGICAED